ncbi:MAG: hypothetical protein KF708_24545 [Pirellulales bacterium]|nr:hypothetical protein [Pirellulales bacterium]
MSAILRLLKQDGVTPKKLADLQFRPSDGAGDWRNLIPPTVRDAWPGLSWTN